MVYFEDMRLAVGVSLALKFSFLVAIRYLLHQLEIMLLTKEFLTGMVAPPVDDVFDRKGFPMPEGRSKNGLCRHNNWTGG